MLKSTQDLEKEMQAEGKLRDEYNRLHNEGNQNGYNPHEDRLAELLSEYNIARNAESPLTLDLAGERAWINAQGFTSLADANKACLARGYSLADLQAAIKKSK